MTLLFLGLIFLALGIILGKFFSSKSLNQNSEAFLKLATQTMETFQEKAKAEFEKKEQSIEHLVKPVKESLEKFDAKIKDLENARMGAYVSIKEQVASLMQSQKDLKMETGNLVKALRTPIVRGRWGEIQLRRVVEMAGMVGHCDFFEQESITSAEEKKLRPDMLVRLPNNRHIIVDAKAPLSSYLDSLECQDEKEAKLKLKDHARQIRQHMTQLGRKSYQDELNSSPDFVVLFLPSEAFFSAALENDQTLIEMGVEQNVILATPTTLIALLKTVAFGWRQEALSKNAEEVSLLGKELYKRLSDMGGHFAKLGKHLEHAIQSYNQTLGTFESRVLVSARRFYDLETATKEMEILEPITQLPRFLKSEEFSQSREPGDSPHS